MGSAETRMFRRTSSRRRFWLESIAGWNGVLWSWLRRRLSGMAARRLECLWLARAPPGPCSLVRRDSIPGNLVHPPEHTAGGADQDTAVPHRAHAATRI